MRRPIRILYLLNAAAGGATTSALQLMERLPAHKYETYVVVPPVSDQADLSKFNGHAAQVRTLLIPWWNKKTYVELWKRPLMWASTSARTVWHVRPILQLCRWIREWEIDLVHTNTALTIDGALAARLCSIPHIWHIREYAGRGRLFQFWLPDALLARTFTGLSDRVIVNSAFTGGLFRRHGQMGKVAVIHNGVDVSAFRDQGCGQALRLALGVSGDELLVGMVANVTSTWKRHDLFIEMAANLASGFPEARFVVFGFKPSVEGLLYNQGGRYFEDLEQKAAALEKSGRFTWAGFCEDIPQMMDAIDVLVHPCGQESFGRIVLEAMAASRPVVGVKAGGVAEIVIDGVTGFLVEPANAHALAEATARLVSDPELRQAMGNSGRRRAEAHFSLEQHVQQMTKVYEEVMRAKA